MKPNGADFRLEGYLIRKSLIEIKEDFDTDSELNLSINPKGIKHEDKFKLILDVSINDSENKFSANVVIEANFKFRENIEMECLGKFFTINAPAIIFPYIRGYISMLTSLSGCGNVLLPTLNLVTLGRQLSENITED